MTRYELLKTCLTTINVLRENGIRLSEADNLPLYEKYNRMKSKGHKMCYIVAVLATEYGISERSVYKIVDRFNTKLTIKPLTPPPDAGR